MYISPNTRNFVISTSPGILTLAGLVTLPFQPAVGVTLISVGVFGQAAAELALGKNKQEPRKLDSLGERFVPMNKLIKKMPQNYYPTYWESGYQSDYSLLSETIENAQKIIEIESEELKFYIHCINSHVRFYNSIFKEIQHLFKDSELEMCKINIPPIDESNSNLKEVKKVLQELSDTLDQASANVQNLFPSLGEQSKQELLEKETITIKEWMNKAQPIVSKLFKKMKLLDQVQKIKNAIDGV